MLEINVSVLLSLLFYRFSFTYKEGVTIQQLMGAINHFIDEMQLPCTSKAIYKPQMEVNA